jgi:uncharacterized SAM-binding protein YcdF (DUF218 family)
MNAMAMPAGEESRTRSSRLASAPLGAAVGALAGFLMRDLDLPALVSYDHSREPLVLLAALLGAAFFAAGLRLVLVGTTAALALLWCVVAFTPLSGWLSHGLNRTERVEPADAVFVSVSSLRPGADGPAEVRNRIFHGIFLLARGQAPTLVICASEGTEGPAIARDLLDAAGVKAELLVLPRAENTRAEALAVADLARKRGFKLVLLVTSPIHSRRASAALEKEGVTVVSSPSEETRFNLDTLDTWSDRLAAFGSVMHERLGLWVYARRGWVGPAAD